MSFSRAIAVVDYHKGNLKSVERGLRCVGADVFVSDDPKHIENAAGIVVPGVGSFADASKAMTALHQIDAIRAAVVAGVPFLGICLGLHLMFEEGTEGSVDVCRPGGTEGSADARDAEGTIGKNAPGLALLPGIVDVMPSAASDGRSLKVPHVGWNTVEFDEASAPSVLAGIPSGEYFYFTHSYIAPPSPYTVARTTHSVTFPSIVVYRDFAIGVQFHPEKSSDAGLELLKNFHMMVKGM